MLDWNARGSGQLLLDLLLGCALLDVNGHLTLVVRAVRDHMHLWRM